MLAELINKIPDKYNNIIISEDLGGLSQEERSEYLNILYKLGSPGAKLRFIIQDVAEILSAYNNKRLDLKDILSLLCYKQDAMPPPMDLNNFYQELEAAGFQFIAPLELDSNFKREVFCRKPLKSDERLSFGPRKVIINTFFNNIFSRGVLGQNILNILHEEGVEAWGLEDLRSESLPELSGGLGDYISFGAVPAQRDILLRVDHINFLENYGSPLVRAMYNKTPRRWGYFFHESSALSKAWLSDLRYFDKIFTPSTFCAQAFQVAGLPKSVEVLPHGYDPGIFYPGTEREARNFRFLSVARQSERKGLNILIQAFKKAFNKNDPVELVIKDTPEGESRKLNGDLLQDANIRIINKSYSSRELGDLYRACDCFVLPTRVEGFGLTILEAKACGLPVIATNYGGHLDFCNKNDTYLIDYKLTQRREELSPEGRDLWAEPEVEHLSLLMQNSINNTQERELFARRGLERVRGMTWRRVLKPLAQALKEG
jgi:glycosyltransferase involved in cell wall biosynthesis